jgi:hypothetical protein
MLQITPQRSFHSNRARIVNHIRSLWQREFNRACDIPRNPNFVERDRRPSAVIPTMKPKFVPTMHISFARLSIVFRVFKYRNTLQLQVIWTRNLLQCSTREPYRLSHSIFEDLVHEKCLAEASTLQVRSLIGSSTWVQNWFYEKFNQFVTANLLL